MNYSRISDDKLKEYLKKLPPEDRCLLLMKYQDEMNNREIGHMLNISENAVDKQLHKASERLITIHDRLLNFTANNEKGKQ